MSNKVGSFVLPSFFVKQNDFKYEKFNLHKKNEPKYVKQFVFISNSEVRVKQTNQY